MQVMPEPYADQLSARYGEAIADQITNFYTMQFAPLPEQPGQNLPFVEVRPAESENAGKKILYVPGFGEDIINKASFAAELALHGRHVILPGQNRKGTLKDETGKPSSLYTQALNYLAVHDAAADGPVDVVAHSYGSLVFEEMARLEPDKFKDSDAVMLAPAGSIDGQRLLTLGARWLRFIKSESDKKRPMEFPDNHGYTAQASAKVLAANPLRALREVGDLLGREMDYGILAQTAGSLTVLSYAEDRMFPQKAQEPMLSDAVKAGCVTWASPVSPAKVLSGEMSYPGDGAVHDDEQYNPSRVAKATLQFLS